MNTQAKLEIEEANCKLWEANVILCRIDKFRRCWKKHVKRLHNKKKMLAEENLKLKSLLKLNNIFNDDQIKVLTSKNAHSVKWSNSTIMLCD